MTVAKRATVVGETEQARAIERALPKAMSYDFASAIRAICSSCFGSLSALDANIPFSSLMSHGRFCAASV
jgi:hypothetical protein